MLKNNFNCCSSISRCERCILIVLGPHSSVRSRNRCAFFPLLLSNPHPLQVMVPNCSVHFVQSQGLRTLWLNIDSVSLVITTSQLLIKYIRDEEGDKKNTTTTLRFISSRWWDFRGWDNYSSLILCKRKSMGGSCWSRGEDYLLPHHKHKNVLSVWDI